MHVCAMCGSSKEANMAFYYRTRIGEVKTMHIEMKTCCAFRHATYISIFDHFTECIILRRGKIMEK